MTGFDLYHWLANRSADYGILLFVWHVLRLLAVPLLFAGALWLAFGNGCERLAAGTCVERRATR